MKKSISIKLSFVCLLSLIFLSSCKTKKATSESTGIESYSAEDVKYKIMASNIYFDFLEASGVAEISSPDLNISGNFVLRLHHDNTAWMVVKKFGIEAARVLIQNDTITVLNRFEKSVYQMQVKDGLKKLGLNMSQNDIIEFLAGNSVIHNSKFVSIKQDSFTYEYKTAFDDLIANYTFDAVNESVERATFADMQNNTFSVGYSDFRVIDEVQMTAYNRFLETNDPRIGETSVNLKFKEISINEELSFPFDIPVHYTKKQ